MSLDVFNTKEVQDLLKAAVAGERFEELFFANAQDAAIADYVRRARAS